MEDSSGLANQTGLIAVVEDDAGVCKSLKFSLEVVGYLVRTYACGEDLLHEPGISDCHCFVVDEKLSGMGSVTLIEKLREKNVLASAILIASLPSATLRKRATAANIDIVEKPILGGALLDCVHRAITPPDRQLH